MTPGTRLEPGGAYDGIELRGRDLSGQWAPNARFVGCGLSSCRLDGANLAGVHLVDCKLEDLGASSLGLAESSWRDVLVDGCRFGSLEAYESTMVRVGFEGGKLDFVNLRGSKLRDVAFDGCAIGEVDLGMAELRSVRFTDCRIDKLQLSGARLDDVDLSSSKLLVVDGIGSLAGATMSADQLMALGVAMGRHLGVRVQEPRDAG